MALIARILPHQLDNNYHGTKLAKWAFWLIAVITMVRSLIHIFSCDGGAQSIATIPLQAFSANAAATVVLLMALWGLSQLLMGMLYLIVLWRYQALIPLMYLEIFCEYLGRMLIMHFKPILIMGSAPGHSANFVMIPLALILFYLSVKKFKPAHR